MTRTLRALIDATELRDLFEDLEDRATAQAVMGQLVGEGIVDRAKRRFRTGTAPDGQAWAPNKPSTLNKLLRELLQSQGAQRKDGSLSQRAQARLAAKRPLIDSKALSQQIAHQVDSRGVEIIATPVYAAMQQWGGTRAQFPHLWGDIPARPYLPFRQDETLYPQEARLIVDELIDYLVNR